MHQASEPKDELPLQTEPDADWLEIGAISGQGWLRVAAGKACVDVGNDRSGDGVGCRRAVSATGWV